VMKTIAYARAVDCYVVAIGRAVIQDGEYDQYLDALNAERDAGMPGRILVHTLGGALTPSQRVKLEARAAAYDQSAVKIAILTDATFAQGVVKAISWNHGGYRVFAAHDLERALAYLDVPVHLTDSIRSSLNALMSTVL
jgi:hypothetical protein